MRVCRLCGRETGGAALCLLHRGKDGTGKNKGMWEIKCGICKGQGHNARSHYVDDPAAIEEGAEEIE